MIGSVLKAGVRKLVGVFKSAGKKARSFALRAMLMSGQPGGWASDHRTQADHFTSWTYIAVHQKSTQAMQAKVEVFEDSPEEDVPQRSFKYMGVAHTQRGDQEPVSQDHPVRRLMKRPNPFQSGKMLRYEISQQLGLTGTAIVVKVRNQLDDVVELYCVPTAMAQPLAAGPDLPNGGYHLSRLTRFYPVMSDVDDDGFVDSAGLSQLANAIVPAEDCAIIRWPHPLWKDDGFSPLQAGAVTIDTANALDSSRWHKFQNQFDGTVVISPKEGTDPTEDELDRAREVIEEKYGGPENTGRVMFTPAGATAAMLGASAKDMDYTGGFVQLRDAILAIHGVPAVAAGIIDGGSYAAFYAALKQFTTLTIQPLLDLIAAELTESLAKDFGEDIEIAFTAAQIDDPDLLEARLTNDIAAQVLLVGEYRQIRGLPPLGDERDEAIVGTLALSGLSGESPHATDQPDRQTQTGLPGVPMMPGASAPKAGEMGELSRLQWTRNRRAISDLLGELQDGSVDPAVAQELLIALGLDEQRAERLVNSVVTGGQVSKRLKAHRANTDHGGASLMLMLSQQDAGPFLEYGDAVMSQDLTGAGLTTEPHITVKFGLPDDSVERVQKLLTAAGPIKVRIGSPSLFRNPGRDVLKVAVSSAGLNELHGSLYWLLAQNDEFPTYEPHITIATVEPGAGTKYLDPGYWEELIPVGRVLTFGSAVFSDSAGVKTVLSYGPMSKPKSNGHVRMDQVVTRLRLRRESIRLPVPVADGQYGNE